MFRDLKEYQEIAKIYAEKVSKPENLEERRGASSEQLTTNRKDAFKGVPNSASNKRAEASSRRREIQNKNKPKTRAEVGLPPKKKPSPFERKFGKERNEKRMISQGVKKKLPTTDEIRAKDKAAGGTGMSNIPKAEGNAVIDGKKLNPDFGKKTEIKKEPEVKPLTKREKFDKKFIKKDKGVGFVKRGTAVAQRPENKEKARLRSQEMLKKRLADKEAGIPQLSGKERAQKLAKERLAKKNAMEEYTPYDFVLEYLLSTEQAATIEEANYVMTEMDAETIQGIVEEQKKTLDEMDMMKMPVINVLGGVGSAIAGTVAAAKYLGRKAGERAIKKEGEKPGKPGLVKTIKDRTDATNKAIEKMKNP